MPGECFFAHFHWFGNILKYERFFKGEVLSRIYLGFCYSEVCHVSVTSS